MYDDFRLNWALDFMDRGIYHRDVLPMSGNGSVADIVATRDWNTSLVRLFSILIYLGTYKTFTSIYKRFIYL